MSDTDTELDPRETVLHPRYRTELFGHELAEKHLLDAYRGEHFHHAWLITGPPGIGKATLAYRAARFILANPDPSAPDVVKAENFQVNPQNQNASLINARAHPNLFVLKREINPKNKSLFTVIRVDDARRILSFFGQTAGQGGWRVCIIDAADEFNLESANALLKSIEEPPAKCVFFIVAHSTARLLPTIRSRCLKLPLEPLRHEDFVKAIEKLPAEAAVNKADIERYKEFSHGSPGRFLQLSQTAAGQYFAVFLEHIKAGSPGVSRQLLDIATKFKQRGGETEFNLFSQLLLEWLAAEARQATGTNDPYATKLADVYFDFSRSIRTANSLNLDRRQTVVEALEAIFNLRAKPRQTVPAT